VAIDSQVSRKHYAASDAEVHGASFQVDMEIPAYVTILSNGFMEQTHMLTVLQIRYKLNIVD